MELDGYVDLVAIGSGGNAHVYQARNKDGDAVAVKVLLGGGDATIARRFAREVRLMEDLTDIDGLVPTLDSGTTNTGDPYLVMPLFSGGSLADELKHGPMPWSRAVSLMLRICLSLAQAHDRQILHLDVKPANVLLDGEGHPWLSDFGIAEIAGSTASMSGAMMTPAYTPPERLRDTKPSALTDVYGVGATLFALLTGAAPFGAETKRTNPAAVMMSVLNDPVPIERLPPDVPADVAELIQKSMAKEPDDRLSSVDDVAQRLRNVLASHDHDPDLVIELGGGSDLTVQGRGVLDAMRSPERDVARRPTVQRSPDPEGTIVGPSQRDRIDSLQVEPEERPNVLFRVAVVLLVLGAAAALAVTVARQIGGDTGQVTTAADSTSDEGASTSFPPLSTTTTLVDSSIAGTTVRLLANIGEDAELEMIADRFEERLGVTIEFTTTRNFELFERELESDMPPDLVILTDHADAEQRCGDGRFAALGTADVDVLRVDFHDGLLIEGSGNTCGAALSSELDFVIWYNPKAMTNAGYEIPTSWDELLVVSERIIADGFSPWCLGFKSGGLAGYHGAEWVQNFLIRTAPLETYDGLFTGDVAWSDPSVLSAFERVDDLLAEGQVRGGRTQVASTDGWSAETVRPMFFTERPSCFFHPAPPWAPSYFPEIDGPLTEGVDYDFIPFPVVDRAQGERQIVRAQFIAATSDRPEVTATLRYLLSTEGQSLRANLGLHPANRNVDESEFIAATQYRPSEILQGTDDVRVSGSNRLDIGQSTAWWDAMIDLANETAPVDEIVASLDQEFAEIAQSDR